MRTLFHRVVKAKQAQFEGMTMLLRARGIRIWSKASSHAQFAFTHAKLTRIFAQ